MRGVRACAAALLCFPGLAAAAEVEVEVDGIEPGPGSVYVALCQGGLFEASCREGQDAPARGPRHRFVFQGIDPGSYAVAAFQERTGAQWTAPDAAGAGSAPGTSAETGDSS